MGTSASSCFVPLFRALTMFLSAGRAVVAGEFLRRVVGGLVTLALLLKKDALLYTRGPTGAPTACGPIGDRVCHGN